MASVPRALLASIIVAGALTAGALASYLLRTTPPEPAALPAALPAITLPDLSGTPRSLSEWRGRTVLVNFWATWCAPCRREMPLLESVHTSADGARFQIVGIAIDRPDPVQHFVAETGVTYPILVGQQEALDAADQFGDAFMALPFSVLAAPDGSVLAVHTGELDAADLAAMRALADELASGRLSPAEARARLNGS